MFLGSAGFWALFCGGGGLDKQC